MKIYNFINQIGFKKSYASKFLFIAFLGTHVPLIGIVLFVLFSPKENLNTTIMITSILIFTVLAAVLTMFALNKLLDPIKIATKAMNAYSLNNTIIDVPKNFTDEAGVLLNKIHDALNRIEDLSKERQNFTSMISHDLRSPLSSIVAIAEVIEHETDDKNIIEYSNMLHKLGSNALNMIKSILQVIESKNFKIDPQEMQNVNTKDFIEKQLINFQPLLKDKNISINIIESTKNTSMFVSPKLIASVIQNLISNAIKFSHKNSEININIESFENQPHISFIDQGIGFNQEQSTELFKKFTSISHKGTSNEDSSGIGLFLSKTITEKHGGKLTAKSNGINKGATFTVKLPHKEKSLLKSS
ncbi:Signal transduction histidine kinase [Psychroflexus salarius]|uniref:histidine kinase n=1 Tax=Psychroflexus salarius TaxID=1155689 RepID=A0A1M4VKK2_9FLAO|nr:HAMP domain-containing sensor histidine kinase [Psychroflexus salarius]SHE69438.1 Signal transduction histidine kinase [Psychroflexus salarius]